MSTAFRFSKHAEERMASRGLQNLKSMRIRYDKETDIIYIQFSNSQITESDEEKPGIILDYDSEGGIVGIEVLNASSKMDHANSVIYEVA